MNNTTKKDEDEELKRFGAHQGIVEYPRHSPVSPYTRILAADA
jgi:hypothetical protein